jgi:hypothetical protein
VRNDGIPIVGFTWYSLTDQVDWDIAIRERHGTVNPRGLFDLDRHVRPVGESFRQLITDWAEVLPTRSVCLRVPVVSPSEYAAGGTNLRQRESAAKQGAAPTEASKADS